MAACHATYWTFSIKLYIIAINEYRIANKELSFPPHFMALINGIAQRLKVYLNNLTLENVLNAFTMEFPSDNTDQPSHSPMAPPNPERRSTLLTIKSSLEWEKIKWAMFHKVIVLTYRFKLNHPTKLNPADASVRTTSQCSYLIWGECILVKSNFVFHCHTWNFAHCKA